MRDIDAATAKDLVHAPAEVAFLDVREHGPYGEGHPLLAVWCPYSRLELLALSLVPNFRVPVVLIDAGDGVAEKAASRLERLGYQDIRVVTGGVQAWIEAGYTLFEGEYVPSKTLGELAEHVFHPDVIDPETLAEWQREHRPHFLVDVRPPTEHHKMTIPGARCLPNGELPHRFPAVVSDTSIPLVLTCAGRTRSLIGAISLKLLGLDNPVYGLRNGTQGWTLAGLDLNRGQVPAEAPSLSHGELAASRLRAQNFAQRAGIPMVDAGMLGTFAADRSRTLYLLDVRSGEEYAAAHLQGAIHAPCVQIVQATDRWLGVRRARVVLADDTGLRASLAAYWLRQIGYETYVLTDTDTTLAHDGWRPFQASPVIPAPGLQHIAPREAAEAAAGGKVLLLDLRLSIEYRREHPAGSRWTIRPELKTTLGDWQGSLCLIADESIARLAALDLREIGYEDVRIVSGGLDAWKSAGLATETGWPESTACPIDFLSFVHDRHDGNLDAARQYLAWETGLLDRLDAQERATFLL
ncbi:rhodanese-like domain-containing protein [Microvirga sp. TS319]|uniref:rhodanese-like domain-containing protein n=1 Tax=Microvirga sp. TS319 TaxID=3241165 RepID=UPI00351A2913